MKKFELQAQNAKYEYGEYAGPIIKPAEELLKIIIEEKNLCAVLAMESLKLC